MNGLQTLYIVLGIRNKIENESERFLYLQNVWGMGQKEIAECEGLSQPTVSRKMKEASFKCNMSDIQNLQGRLQWSMDEIEYLQKLPREVIGDTAVVAFINNILGVKVDHPFYHRFQNDTNIRIAALASLGVRQVRLREMFNRSQPHTSNTVKQFSRRAAQVERVHRYMKNVPLKQIMGSTPLAKSKFLLAGGTE